MRNQILCRKAFVFTALFCFFASIQVNAQQIQNYNPHALEYFKKSLEYLVQGDYQNTIINCNNVIRLDPNSAINYVIRSRAYYEISDYDKAIADCNQAIRLDRNNAAAYVIRGNAYAKKEELNRAISDWEAALRINPNIPEAAQNIELARSNQLRVLKKT